jgi:hypothetical protein
MGFRIEAPKQDGNARFNTLKVNLQENLSATRAVVVDTDGNFYYGVAGSGGSAFPFTGSAGILGSLIVTGSVSSTGGFTGSLQGTASWAINAQTASFVFNSISASYVSGSSAIITNLTSSLNASIGGINIGRGANLVIGNIAIGATLPSSSAGGSNVAIALGALNNLTTGTDNVSIGGSSLLRNTTGAQNIGLGPISLFQLSTGSRNVSIGNNSLRDLVSGSYNTVIGYGSGRGIVSGSFNTIIGAIEGLSSSLGIVSLYNNVIIGDSGGNIRAWHNAVSWSFSGSVVAPQGFTGSLQGTASWAKNTISSSYPIAVTGSTLYSVNPNAGTNFNTNQNIFLGEGSGQDSTYTTFGISLGYQAGYQSNFSESYADNSGDFTASVNFIGYQAGYQSSGSRFSNFIGNQAGYQTALSNGSNFIGDRAGYLSKTGSNSNFIGRDSGFLSDNIRWSNLLGVSAGEDSLDIYESNFIGDQAGENSKNIRYSNFIGYQAGLQASSSIYSNFIGAEVGLNITSSYSTLIGYRVGTTNPGDGASIGSNNIIIGTNISLEKDRKDSINLGGLIFGTGSYSDLSPFASRFSGSANGRIGINQPLPQFNLDVSGSGRYTNGLTASGSIFFSSLTQVPQNNVVLINNTTGQLYYTASSALSPLTSSFAATASYVSSSNVYGPYGFDSIQTSSFALTASSANNFTVRGTLTAQTIVAQVITSSTEYITGSTIFGSELSNTHQFTGSVNITGSLKVNDSLVILSNQTGSMSVATSSYAFTASYVDATNVNNLFRIATGSVSASVNVTPESLFLINSGFTQYFNISSSGNIDIYSNLFIVRNFNTQQPVLTVSQSIVQIATQSFDPTGITQAGSIWFTSASMFVGLE